MKQIYLLFCPFVVKMDTVTEGVPTVLSLHGGYALSNFKDQLFYYIL